MSLSPIDWTHLQTYSRGDIAFEAELLSLFMEHTQVQINSLHQAWVNRDFKALAQVAHQLKSSCGTIGAGELYRLMSEIEAHAALQSELPLAQMINALDPEFAKVLDEIHQYTCHKNLSSS